MAVTVMVTVISGGMMVTAMATTIGSGAMVVTAMAIVFASGIVHDLIDGGMVIVVLC
jgi:hypothetical protein